MPVTRHGQPDAQERRLRVLVVADWTVDPHAVVAALSRRAADAPCTWSVVVPAWLHGVDWAGDPRASGPCAEKALLTLRELAVRAGLDVDLAIVGDPHPITAAQDVCASMEFDEVLLCVRRRRFAHAHPLDVAHRLHAATGLPIRREAVGRVNDGHCHEVAGAAA